MKLDLSKQKTVIVVTVLIDAIGLGIIIPVMPYFVQSFGASAVIITALFAVFSFCSFFSAPLLGSWSDKFGRRPALIISLFTTAVGWFVFGAATSLFLLFVGRVIDGLAAGNFTIAQSYIADISKNDRDRTGNMGIVGALFGFGFIVGPAIGSLLSHLSLSFPFYFVGVLAGINTIAAYLFLPETNDNLHKDKIISVNPFRPILLAAKDRILRAHYTALFLFSLAIAIQHSIFALFLQRRFGLEVAGTGYALTAMGIIMVVNQGFLLKNFWLKKFRESWLEVWMFLFFAVSFFLMSVPSIVVFIFGTAAMMLSQSVLRAVLASRIIGFASVRQRGEVSGTISAIVTLGMIGGPLASGVIFIFNPRLPFIVSGIILLAAFFVMLVFRRTLPEFGFHRPETEPIEVV